MISRIALMSSCFFQGFYVFIFMLQSKYFWKLIQAASSTFYFFTKKWPEI